MDSGGTGDNDHGSRAAGTADDAGLSALINGNSNKRRALSNNYTLTPCPANFDLLNLDMAPRSVPSSYPYPLFGSFSTATTTTAAAAEPPSAPEQIRRNPKKRTRASRRAPTTVLTTDTSNFRAMVQEFTGIPAPPFFPMNTHRLDHYGTSKSYLSTTAFPQKPPPPPFLTSSMLDLDHHSTNFQLPNATSFNGHVRAGGVITDHVINPSSSSPQLIFRSNHVQQHSNELGHAADDELLQPTGR